MAQSQVGIPTHIQYPLGTWVVTLAGRSVAWFAGWSDCGTVVTRSIDLRIPTQVKAVSYTPPPCISNIIVHNHTYLHTRTQ